MKISTAIRAKRFWLLLSALVLAIIFGFRCGTSKPTTDPLADFHFSSLNNLDSNKTITADYQDYIKKLSLKSPDFVGSVDYSEDATGRHAVHIEIGIHRKWWDLTQESGRWWEHILIYDKDNNRLKVIKYRNGGYGS